jgi:hypothetical protein
LGWRLQRAIGTAERTDYITIRINMEEPMMALENESVTTARYNQPSRVRM